MAGGRFVVAGLGEILWDLLPAGKKLGGAPANFAYHALALGDRAYPVSRIGADGMGREIRERIAELGVSGDYLQNDPGHPTGTVDVQLDERGQPAFTITPDVAWDYLEWTDGLKAFARKADAVCFGSVAQRSARSRATIRRFLETMRRQALKIFDVNLRQSYYSSEVLRESLEASTIAKLNGDELPAVLSTLGLSAEGGLEEGCRRLREAFALELVCVTLGAEGSFLAGAAQACRNAGFTVKVADTVGAGDAFTAALCHHRLRGASLERIGEAANRYGAWVASQVGPTPPVSEEILREVV